MATECHLEASYFKILHACQMLKYHTTFSGGFFNKNTPKIFLVWQGTARRGKAELQMSSLPGGFAAMGSKPFPFSKIQPAFVEYRRTSFAALEGTWRPSRPGADKLQIARSHSGTRSKHTTISCNKGLRRGCKACQYYNPLS